MKYLDEDFKINEYQRRRHEREKRYRTLKPEGTFDPNLSKIKKQCFASATHELIMEMVPTKCARNSRRGVFA